MGLYRIRNLPLGTYTITGSKKGYDTFTDTVRLTEQHPDKQVFVDMEPNDESVNRAKLGISDLHEHVNVIAHEILDFMHQQYPAQAERITNQYPKLF